jgi:hypothetical protein
MFTDTERLNWLIANGYTPAKWKCPQTAEEVKDRNGLVYVGLGERDQIDEAMIQGMETRGKFENSK